MIMKFQKIWIFIFSVLMTNSLFSKVDLKLTYQGNKSIKLTAETFRDGVWDKEKNNLYLYGGSLQYNLLKKRKSKSDAYVINLTKDQTFTIENWYYDLEELFYAFDNQTKKLIDDASYKSNIQKEVIANKAKFFADIPFLLDVTIEDNTKENSQEEPYIFKFKSFSFNSKKFAQRMKRDLQIGGAIGLVLGIAAFIVSKTKKNK